MMMERNNYSNVNQVIKGAIIAYNIKSDGDTEYILRELIQTVMEEIGRSLTRT